MKRTSVFLVALLTATTASASFKLQPHRAVYEITFKSAPSESTIADVKGRWVNEITGSACKGYTVAYRLVSRFSLENGSSLLIDTRAKNFENAKSDAFDYSNTTYRNNVLVDDFKGLASRKDGGLDVALTKPKADNFGFSEEILFPVEHYRALIKSAIAGKEVVSHNVFEGTDGGKTVLQASAKISPEDNVASKADAPYADLDKQKIRRWPMRVSYFKPDAKGDATPAWVNEFVMYENGVSRSFTLDYGNVAVNATMTNLELLDEEEC